MRKKGEEKENKEMARRGGDVEMNGKLVRELVEEVRGELERGEVRTVEEALSKRGVSRKLFREMGGIEEWKGERRRGGRGGEEREEVEEMGKEELGKFLSRVIRGRELGMGEGEDECGRVVYEVEGMGQGERGEGGAGRRGDERVAEKRQREELKKRRRRDKLKRR